jgi:hypothetical protein
MTKDESIQWIEKTSPKDRALAQRCFELGHERQRSCPQVCPQCLLRASGRVMNRLVTEMSSISNHRNNLIDLVEGMN